MRGKRKARPDEVIGSAEPGSKREFNKLISKGDQKIKPSDSTVIVGEPGHRYYSILLPEEIKGGLNGRPKQKGQ